MRDRVWLAFDLSVGGDLTGMYRWLAGREARECGPALATFFYEYRGELVEEMRRELRRAVRLAPGDRIYLIYKDPHDGEVTGLFLFGRRGGWPHAGLEEPARLTPLN